MVARADRHHPRLWTDESGGRAAGGHGQGPAVADGDQVLGRAGDGRPVEQLLAGRDDEGMARASDGARARVGRCGSGDGVRRTGDRAGRRAAG